MGFICYFFDTMPEPLDTSDLLAFTKTIEAKSLSRAAAELATPRATIGRRLARLEQRLGVRLIRRTTRALALTDAGNAFYRHARIVLDAATQAEESVRKSDLLRGTLRVAVPPLNDVSFNRLLCDFAKAHPAIALHVNAAARYVDLIREGYDVALRASTELEPGLVVRTLQRTKVVAVASPGYLEKNGVPKTARDLKSHACLLGTAGGELPQTHWPRVGGGKIRVEGTFVTNDLLLLVDAAMSGLGIGLFPTVIVRELVARGMLVHLMPSVIGAESRISLVYVEKEFVSPQVRAFVDAVVAWSPQASTTERVLERYDVGRARRASRK
jgi:DNA-binding transcriptional LysR family regulator